MDRTKVYDMQQELDVLAYQRVNASFRRRMVCRVGIDCGFFVEMNYMLNAMLYCLAHRIRFQLYSEDANFGTGVGWTEYFLPFCEEVHEPFHRRYNFHRLPSWCRILKECRRKKSVGPVVWKVKSAVKTHIGRFFAFGVYREYVLLAQDVVARPESHYYIPELAIDSDYTQAYRLLARMVWRLRPDMLCRESLFRERLALPPLYDGVQVRGGDKATEAELVSGLRVMSLLNLADTPCVFVLTDDYRQILALQAQYPKVRFLTLCLPEERGYHHQAFCKESPERRREAIVRLIVSVDLLLGCRTFIGSITTGPSVFVLKLRADDPLV